MRKWKRLAVTTSLFSMAAILVAGAVLAEDVIRTKRGHKYVGEIKKETADTVEIEIVVQGIPFVIPIQKDEIEEKIYGVGSETAPTPVEGTVTEPEEPTPLPEPTEPVQESPVTVESEPTPTPTPAPEPTDTPTPEPASQVETGEETVGLETTEGDPWGGVELRAREIFQAIVQTEDAQSRVQDIIIPPVPPALPLGEYHEVTASNLNIRQGPSTDFDKTGAALRGTIVRVNDRADQWLNITTPDGQRGWVSSRFTNPLAGDHVVITGTNVNFREGPTTRALSLRKFDQGEIALMLKGARHSPEKDPTVLEPGDFWIQLVDVHGNIGWMAAQFAARVINDRVLTPPIHEDPDVDATGHFSAGEVEAGPGHRQQWRVVVNEDNLMRNGRIGVVVLYSGAIETDKERLGLLSTPDEDDLLWRSTYQVDHLAKLGFDAKMLEMWEGGTIAYIKGREEDGAWVFDVAVTEEAARSTPETPLELEYALTVQGGENRGVLLPFYAPGRM